MLNDPNNKFYMGSDEMKITAPIDKIESLLTARTDRTIDMTENDFVFTKNQPVISSRGNMRYPGDALFIPDADPATNDAYWDTIPNAGQGFYTSTTSNLVSLDITNLPTNLQGNEVIKITYHTEITFVGQQSFASNYSITSNSEATYFSPVNINNTTNLSPFNIQWKTAGTELPETLVTYKCTGVTVEVVEFLNAGATIVLNNRFWLSNYNIGIGDTLEQKRSGAIITGVIDDTYLDTSRFSFGERVVVLKNVVTSSSGEFFRFTGSGFFYQPTWIHRINSNGTTTPAGKHQWDRLNSNNSLNRMIADYGDQTTASKTITFSTPFEYTILVDNTTT
jgi:hypothetical protein